MTCFILTVFLLNRPISNTEDGTRETAGVDSSGPVKLDAAAQAHIEKHRYIHSISIFSI